MAHVESHGTEKNVASGARFREYAASVAVAVVARNAVVAERCREAINPFRSNQPVWLVQGDRIPRAESESES